MNTQPFKLFNIDIAAGTRSGQSGNVKLDPGTYDRIHIVNRFNNNLDKAAEIKVTDATGSEIMPKIDTRGLEQTGGEFLEAKAPCHVEGNQSINIEFTTHANVDADTSYQVIFWRKDACKR
ncbi:hypothetical protein [Nonlabens agnitus]|uniref:Uncharacterized protein n=1 Tax=Nonlabens agnitus TaxID=870484 RepID=A0A2S9WXK2_9FLAO|nr:hypothetical protein [Nonlabens agnitus]PRP68106.1 hypothetical protein BST86_13925 [Nonlabens agnitus]